jgi:hypothetical protein
LAAALDGELIDARCRRAAQLAAAIGADVAVADVVGEDKENVGLLLLPDSRRARRYHGRDRCQQTDRYGPGHESVSFSYLGLDVFGRPDCDLKS